jgi:hypothetical protein
VNTTSDYTDYNGAIANHRLLMAVRYCGRGQDRVRKLKEKIKDHCKKQAARNLFDSTV